MFQTVNFSDFLDTFRALDRASHFSYEGARLLFAFLEEVEADSGIPLEFDAVALCCEYSEDSPEDIAKAYGIEGDVEEWLEENTIVVGVTSSGSIVYVSAF